MNRTLILLFFWIFFTSASDAFPVTPMESYNSLVAGQDQSGLRNGDFDQARFNQPSGLVFDDSGRELFVADSNNRCIRVVHLDENNRVETLVGTGTAGQMDGPFSKASFEQPTALTLLPGHRLAVYDRGLRRLRIVDIQSKTVSTLDLKPEGSLSLWSMVYRPVDGSLYFSDPEKHAVQKIAVKSGEITTLFQNVPFLPNPQALCLDDDRLYVADRDLPDVYQVDWGTTTANASTPGRLNKVGVGDHILALAASENKIYALQGKAPFFALVSPESRPVSFPTVWGFMTSGEIPWTYPLLKVGPDVPEGFVTTPVEPEKFYVTSANSIISFKDYDFGRGWYGADAGYGNPAVTDFNYPEKKPPKTFRILWLGDSRTWLAPVNNPETTVEPGTGADITLGEEVQNTLKSVRVFTLPKQLELMLNTESTLKGSGVHFEVLEDGGTSPLEYPYDITPLVEKYQVDLVIGLAEGPDVLNYFQRPATPDGIPSPRMDPEYLLKPLAQRIGTGTPADLYERVKKRVTPLDEGTFSSFEALLNLDDPAVRRDVLQLVGRPFKVFEEKLKSVKLEDGKTPAFLLAFVPWRNLSDVERMEDFYRDTCKQMGVPFLDISRPYDALKISFYPTDQDCCNDHYTVYGVSLIAYLFQHYLFEKGWLPN